MKMTAIKALFLTFSISPWVSTVLAEEYSMPQNQVGINFALGKISDPDAREKILDDIQSLPKNQRQNALKGLVQFSEELTPSRKPIFESWVVSGMLNTSTGKSWEPRRLAREFADGYRKQDYSKIADAFMGTGGFQ
jgi:hypothetical protein